MKDLEYTLENLKGIEERKVSALILELNESIQKAQDEGYKMDSIYTLIKKHIKKLNKNTFKTSLYRLRKEKSNRPTLSDAKTKEIIPQAEKKPHLEISRTSQSQNKLSQFRKGS